MADKYHTEWKYQDFATDVRIIKAQSRAFDFLGDMANALDDAIGMLEGIEQLRAIKLQTELLRRSCLYLRIANEIGNQFGGVT